MSNEASGCESNAIELLKQKLRHNFASFSQLTERVADVNHSSAQHLLRSEQSSTYQTTKIERVMQVHDESYDK